MADHKTVYVLGAGASYEAGFPLGIGLKDEISSALDFKHSGFETTGGDPAVFKSLEVSARSAVATSSGQSWGGTLNGYMDAAKRIRELLPLSQSIDNLIDANRGDRSIEICGKLAIASAILRKERNSSVAKIQDAHNAYSFNFHAVAGTWLLDFFQILTRDCSYQDVSARLSQVAVINFNYDRSFEHFMYLALMRVCRKKDAELQEILKGLTVFHPYGKVGELLPTAGSEITEYGADVNGAELLKIAKQIKTFTEGTDPNSSDVVSMRESLRRADRIAFLGFAFHPLNMDMLLSDSSPPPKNPRAATVLGTALKMSKSDVGIVCRELERRLGTVSGTTDLRSDLNCERFFPEYSRTLAFPR